ncbi:MAG: DNA cytosine methyltransferase [Oscillatoria sp. SIO1A7]|nr:DNA cytosine methyltransferase [Oscillatoria sp. SIO1A7]
MERNRTNSCKLTEQQVGYLSAKTYKRKSRKNFLKGIDESYYVPGAGSNKNSRAVAGKKPAPTQRALLKSRATRRATLIVDQQIKEFTIDCAKLLMGFPLSFELAGCKYERFAQIGNAVPPKAMAAFLKPVIGIL